jgi:hypothetical protein
MSPTGPISKWPINHITEAINEAVVEHLAYFASHPIPK